MREAIGSTVLFKIMIFFIFFFASFLAIAINYSQAFRIKNSIVNKLEEFEGYNASSLPLIQASINNSGYYREVNCTERGEGVNVVGTNGVCIDKVETGPTNEYIYYKVTTYVSFDLPIIGTFFTVPVKGETKVITNPVDEL